MKNRFGFDAPKSKPIEESIRWAAQNGFSYIDFQADLPPNEIDSFDIERIRMIRHLCEEHNIAIGIHPSSAINNAEYVPIMAEAVDQYLFANLDLAARLGCGWLVGHGGYHFGDVQKRRETAVDRMRRLVEAAERANVVVFFENQKNVKWISDLLEIGVQPRISETSSNSGIPFFEGKVLVITGTLSEARDVWKDRLESVGAKVTGSVSSRTDYLLAGENAGSKLSKAITLGVQVMTEKQASEELS